MDNLSTDEHFLAANSMLKMFYFELLPTYRGNDWYWCSPNRVTNIAKNLYYYSTLYWLKMNHGYDVKRSDIINYGIRFKSTSY